MKPLKTNPRLLCCASMLALTLTACSHQHAKVKNVANINDNDAQASTDPSSVFRPFQFRKNGIRGLRNGKKFGLAANGKNPRDYDNLWERLFDLYSLPPTQHQDIDRELDWFLSHPSYIDRVQRRAEPFLYSIVRQFEKHGIPGEIALLPVIESAFQPHAISPANAAGIWQFIPATGKRYGLKQNRSYDGRRDIYASTRAAIKYLKKLHNDFDGDWLLAVAAYNCGEGAVARAVQRNAARNLPTDFWSLDLPQETRSYVPRLLAVAKLFADSEQYGVDLHHIPNQALFKTVKINSQVDLAMAADAANISLDKMFELNPGFKHQMADVEGGYRLFIPAEKYRTFKEELARMAEQADAWKNRRTEEKDDSSVASEDDSQDSKNKFASAGLLHKGNDGGDDDAFQNVRKKPFDKADTEYAIATPPKPSSRIKESLASAGQPEESADSDNRRTTAALSAHEKESIAAAMREHLHPAKSRILQKSNDDADEDEKPAKLLDKPGKKPSYMVQEGDTLFSIARKNGVELEQLTKWNHLSAKHSLQPGQHLVLWNKDAANKLPIASSGIKSSQSIRYTVRAGDSLFGISKRFNVSMTDLRKWNGTKVAKQFKPGVNLTVSGEKD